MNLPTHRPSFHPHQERSTSKSSYRWGEMERTGRGRPTHLSRRDSFGARRFRPAERITSQSRNRGKRGGVLSVGSNFGPDGQSVGDGVHFTGRNFGLRVAASSCVRFREEFSRFQNYERRDPAKRDFVALSFERKCQPYILQKHKITFWKWY